MSPRQPVVSGERLIKALGKEGWEAVRQRGSHVRLKKAGRRHALVVPLHRELRRGTLAGILRDADLSVDDLRRLLD
ncbi:MAG TPA: type II toxin-antitoxin system HicA family toxin [Solirubrobacterales bacterium]|nr:type II toxin-antitoxin system HicA family toxin [Solirubrobacterales bacterium]